MTLLLNYHHPIIFTSSLLRRHLSGYIFICIWAVGFLWQRAIGRKLRRGGGGILQKDTIPFNHRYTANRYREIYIIYRERER
jgi:hypothetical protein